MKAIWAIGGLAALAVNLPVVVARAQVLEIGVGGAIRVYDGPMVFTAQGAAPIAARPHARAAVGKVAAHRLALARAGIARPEGAKPETVRAQIVKAAELAALSPDLVEAVAWRESGFRTGAVSSAGAVGEMQLMPGTARALGVDPYRSDQNLQGGASYLTAMMRRYDGDIERALAAYNAGPGAVDRYKGVPPYKETRAYVAAVMDRLSRVVELDASGSGR